MQNPEVVGAVSNGNTAIESWEGLEPDVILMDIELGCELNSIATGLIIKGEHPETGIVILSSHGERQYLNLIAAEEAAGWSYLLKQSVSDSDSLARVIRRGLRFGGYESYRGEQYEAKKRLTDCRSNSPAARSAQHDGPGL